MRPDNLTEIASLSKDSTHDHPTLNMSNTKNKEAKNISEQECINTTNQLKMDSSLIDTKYTYSSNDNNASVKSIYDTTNHIIFRNFTLNMFVDIKWR